MGKVGRRMGRNIKLSPYCFTCIFMEILTTSIYFVINECLKKMKSTFRLYRNNEKENIEVRLDSL